MANIIRVGGGGGSATLITKSITQNGTYLATDDNADGYSEVTVDVAGGGGSTNYIGTTTPTSSLGVNGDTYTKYTTYSYQRLNYVETNGGVSSQYVDTGRKFTPKSVVKINAYLDSTAYADWQCIFGWGHNNPTFCIYTRANGNNIIKKEQIGQTDVDITGIYGADVDIEVSATAMSITDGVDTYSGAYTFSDTTASSMRLLSSGYGASNEQGKYRLYDFVWEEDNIEVIHYVPVLDDNNVPCLLNTVNGELNYSNNSSYPLLSGGSTGTTVSGIKVTQTYLKVNGEWEVVDNIYPIVADGIVEFKNYLKFNGYGIVLPWTLDSDYKIEVVFHETTYLQDSAIIGNTRNETRSNLTEYNNAYFTSTGTSGSGFGSWSAGEHTFITNNGNGKNEFDGVEVTNYTPTTDSTINYSIGWRATAGNAFKGWIKSYKVYSISSGDLLHELKPALVMNSPCFYDTIDGKIYSTSLLEAVDTIS